MDRASGPATVPIRYASDPDRAPDDAFERGRLEFLVPGNRGRLLDPRRTPVVVSSIDHELARFEVEVLAFEDAGARWILEAERVTDFQFERDPVRATLGEVAALTAAIERFDRRLDVPLDRAARARTRRRIREAETRARRELGDVAVDLSGRAGDPTVQPRLRSFLSRLGVEAIEAEFASTWASHPDSGEVARAEAIAIAHLGLVPYHGPVLRDATLLAGERSLERRAEHVIGRLGFVRALLRAAGHERVWLFRGLASEAPLGPRLRRTFVSATFDRSVAEALASREATTVVAILTGQLVPVERLFMTYLETAELNRTFAEAEAVLLADRRNRAF
jgi:hypothetical protein